jgi:hypothetical protein
VKSTWLEVKNYLRGGRGPDLGDQDGRSTARGNGEDGGGGGSGRLYVREKK